MKYFLLSLLFVSQACLGQVVGKVVSVLDGDTFKILVEKEQIKVTLYGVDCPEIGQDHGDVAKKFVTFFFGLAGDTVRITKLGKDLDGRTLGIVFVDKHNLNEVLLEKGLAWHNKKSDNNPKWALMEEGARIARFFLWSLPNPIPPWEWRKNH